MSEVYVHQDEQETTKTTKKAPYLRAYGIFAAGSSDPLGPIRESWYMPNEMQHSEWSIMMAFKKVMKPSSFLHCINSPIFQ